MAGFKRLNEQAYDYIKEMIYSDNFIIDQIYSETKLAGEIGISRTPIKNALLKLSQEGYIDILPSKGFIVKGVNENDIIEIFQIRSAIEGYCSLLISKEYKTTKAKKTIVKLNTLLNKQIDAASNKTDIEKFVEFDQKFHKTIIDYAENPVFTTMFENNYYRIKNLAIKSLAYENRLKNTINEHTKILNAISSGDIDSVYNLTLVHLNNPKIRMLEDLKKG